MPSFSVPHIFVEKQIRHGRNNQNVEIKCLQEFRDTPDQFRHLKAGKGARNSNEAVERRRVKATLTCKARNQQWADLICTIKIQNPLFLKKNSRKEVVRESEYFRAAVIKCQRTTGQHPESLGRLCFPAACCEGQIHDDLPLARESLDHGRRIKGEQSRNGGWHSAPHLRQRDFQDEVTLAQSNFPEADC